MCQVKLFSLDGQVTSAYDLTGGVEERGSVKEKGGVEEKGRCVAKKHGLDSGFNTYVRWLWAVASGV